MYDPIIHEITKKVEKLPPHLQWRYENRREELERDFTRLTAAVRAYNEITEQTDHDDFERNP